jgi:hypothetical protein
MKHMKHMLGCLVIIGALILVRLVDGSSAWLVGAALIACPLMMVWMMAGMRHGEGDRHDEVDDHHAHR